jgi:hypothetical protein
MMDEPYQLIALRMGAGKTVATLTAVGQMGGGNVQKQQLDALLKIQAGIDQANRVGGIVA